MFEIEMKAHVSDPERVIQRLKDSGAVYQRDYHKVDRYFTLTRGDGSRQDLRLRSDGDETWLTFKDKELVDGLEINREHETLVGDVAILADLFQRLGCREYIRKTKTGSSWIHGNLHIELSLIHDLGYFIELEQLVEADEAMKDTLAASARGEILTYIASLGIPQDQIESRAYTSMLLARSSGLSP